MRTALGRLPIARAPASDGRTDSDRQPAAGARFADDFTAFTLQLRRRLRDAIRTDSDRFVGLVGWLVARSHSDRPTDARGRSLSRSRGGSRGAAGPSSAAAARSSRASAPASQRENETHARGGRGGGTKSKQASKRASEQWCTFRHYG